MKLDYRYLLLIFFIPFSLMFDRFMYPYFRLQGIGYLEIGIIDAVFSAASLVSIYYFGNLSDRIGRRKTLAVFMTYYAPFSLLYLRVSTFLGGCVVRMAESASSLLYPTQSAYNQDLAHKVNNSKRATFFGFLSTANGLGSFAFPIVAGLVIDSFGFEALALLSFFTVLLIVAFVLALPDPLNKKMRKKPSKRMDLKLLRGKFMKAFSAYYLLTGITAVITWIWIPFVTLDLASSYSEVGLVISASSFFIIFGRIPFGYLADRYGKTRTFVIAGILSPLSLFLIAISSSFEFLLISSVLASFATSIRVPAEGALLSINIQSEKRGEIMSVFWFITKIGIVLGGIAGGIIVTVFDPSAAFLLASTTEAVAILVFIFAIKSTSGVYHA